MDDLEIEQSNTASMTAGTDADKRTSRRDSKRNPLREILETAIIAVLIFVLVRSVVLNFRVDGASMMPTFEGGEMILVNRNAYGEFNLGDLVDWIPSVPEQDWFVITDWGEPERGDVIVFTPPEPGDQKPYIKRVIGLPSDEVVIASDGSVRVNGIHLDEAYIGDFPTQCAIGNDNCDVTVPPGYVFTLGDNRQRGGSEDSRYYGLVSEDRIIGRAWLVYWPMNSIGPIDSPNYPELNP